MRGGLHHSRKLTNLIHFGPAESKVFIVFLYYLVSGALQFTTFSLATRYIDHDIEAVLTYYDCHRNGNNNNCSLVVKQNPVWSLMALIILMLFPAINLVYAVKFSNVKKILRKIHGSVHMFTNTVSNKTDSTVESSGL